MLKLPGLIDPHVHLRDPGNTQKEDFTTGTKAALAGGFTTILDMPNNPDPITTPQKLNQKIKIAKSKVLCDVGFHFGSLSNNLSEFPKIQNKIYGLKIYLNKTTGNFIIDLPKFQKICEAWPTNHPVLLHAESDVIEDAISIGHKFNQKIHICHVSSAKELQSVINAKQKGYSVTCGATPHHLFLSDNQLKALGNLGNVKPNLKPQSDIKFLWQHLKDIDIIESDHAPHTLSEKEEGAFGLPGLETTLPLLLTAVHQGKIEISDIIRLCHTGPAKIFKIPTSEHLEGGKMKQSETSDSREMDFSNTYIEINEDQSWTISNNELFTKCKWSPYNGWKIKGKIKKVYIRGTKVFEDDKILVEPGFGKILKPNN